eukprot:scaffold66878_cov30-Tisochrysis_lutea.AAC.2
MCKWILAKSVATIMPPALSAELFYMHLLPRRFRFDFDVLIAIPRPTPLATNSVAWRNANAEQD